MRVLAMQNEWQTFLVKHGAYFDHERVIHFGNLLDELRLSCNSNIVTDLSYKGLVFIDGVDASKFLQGQLTCDVNQVTTTHSSLGAYCNVKGRILANFRLFKRDNGFYMSLPQKIISPTIAQLQKYAVFSKVSFSDYHTNLVCIGLSGPKVQQILRSILETLPENIDDCLQVANFTVIKISGQFDRYEIYADIAAMKELWIKLVNQVQPAGADTWQLQNIMAGIPTIYPATIGKFTPHQINIPALNGVSFNKGCYVGQEIVARMEHLGKLKSHMHLCHVITKSIPKPGNEIFVMENGEKKPVGMAVIAKPDPEIGYRLLAVLKDECVVSNTCFFDLDPTCYIDFAQE